MSSLKKETRKNFRDACFKRDEYCCVMCNFKSNKDNAQNDLDAHHISSRKDMPHGGYVMENGISLCADCHKKAEEFHSTGISAAGFSPEELYQKIDSSKEKAFKASKMLYG